MKRLPLLTLLFAACQGGADAPPVESTRIQDVEARELVRALQPVLEAAKRGDAAQVAAALQPFLASEPDILRLFGPEVGARVWKGYSGKIIAELQAEAGAALVERAADGQVELTAELVGPARPAATTRGQGSLIDALKVPARVYAVRLHRPGEELGFRLDGWLKVEGQWRALFKAGEHLQPPTDAGAPDEPAPASADAPLSGPSPGAADAPSAPAPASADPR